MMTDGFMGKPFLVQGNSILEAYRRGPWKLSNVFRKAFYDEAKPKYGASVYENVMFKPQYARKDKVTIGVLPNLNGWGGFNER